MEEEELTLAEIAEQRGIPERVVRYWLRNGLPYRQRSRVIFIKVSDLDDFLQRRVEIVTTYRLRPEEESEPDLSLVGASC